QEVDQRTWHAKRERIISRTGRWQLSRSSPNQNFEGGNRQRRASAAGGRKVELLCPAYDNRINHHVSEMRFREGGSNAYRCLPILLSMHELRNRFETEVRRLLRFLQLWLDGMSSKTDRRTGLCLVGPKQNGGRGAKNSAISRMKIRQNFPAA